jgi:hypothetical protein
MFKYFPLSIITALLLASCAESPRVPVVYDRGAVNFTAITTPSVIQSKGEIP